MTTDGTDDYIRQSHAGREAQYQQLFANVDAYWSRAESPPDDDPEREVDESILATDRTRGFTVTISTGGPGEWLECAVDPDGSDIEGVVFCAAWWSPVTRTTVNEGDALWRLAERMNPWSY